MASPTNQTTQQSPSFDMASLFKPNPNSPTVPNPNPNNIYPPPPQLSSSSSYPPPYPPPQISAAQYHHHHNQQPQYHQPQQYHHPIPPPPSPIPNLHHPQRSVSYPAPPLQPQTNPDSIQTARIFAMLGAPPATNSNLNLPNLDSNQQYHHPILPISSEFPPIPNSYPPASAQPLGVMRMQSSKVPKGRHLVGDHVSYDIDVRLPGEVQPQLEVTPITKYQSDPQLVVGRQIAVNRTYICYGLKMGSIRVLNINTALRSLLKGHTQRVSDMAFFAVDVHLLASASVDGRFYVWKISEGPDEEEKSQITGNVVIAIQIVGEGKVTHPRICWHSHKQEILVIGIGKHVLRIDTTKIGKGESYSAEEPIKCSIDKLINGVQYVGKHDLEVTDLSMCQWMTTRLVSASTDGTIKIWEDRKAQPLYVLRPHNGDPVNSAIFMTAPQRPEHIILITAGPLNKQVKFWASDSDEGWLLPSDAESWHCTQTLDLMSSSNGPNVGEAFFNQVVGLSHAGLLLFANAKKNAIYAVHIEYGANPAATRMDYVAEFTVTMPILSFTGTSDLLPNGEHIVQVYCVQTQAIQQYALDLAQCLPPPLDSMGLEKSDSFVSLEAADAEGYAMLGPSGSLGTEVLSTTLALKSTIQDSTSTSTEASPVNIGTDIGCVASPPIPLSPRLSMNLSGFRSLSSSYDPSPPLSDPNGDQSVIEYTVDRQMDNIHPSFSDKTDDDSRNDETKVSQDDVRNSPVIFKHPTHLITPSEILMAHSETTSTISGKSEGDGNIQDVTVNGETVNPEVEVKVVGEAGSAQNSQSNSRASPITIVAENNGIMFSSQNSDLGIEMSRECCAISAETYIVEEAREVDIANMTESLENNGNGSESEVSGSTKDVSGKFADSAIPSTVQQSPTPISKGKKQKGKNTQLPSSSSPSPSVFNSVDSSGEPGASSSIPSVEVVLPQILAMQDSINQIIINQKEMQKQLPLTVAVPVTKESRRLEAALGRSMEKAVKANTDALWARFQEENAKNEKLARDRTQQITTLITNLMSKDLPVMLEKMIKKEVAAVGPAVAHLITPVEKSISSSIAESFQRGVGDKAVNQLERSVTTKLEASVGRQIQAQFQSSGKQALQDALKSGLEASVIPAFEKFCKAMFEQVDGTFQKGMAEHTNAAQQHFDSTHSGLALALRDAINSASSLTQTLSGELADGQRKLLALAAAGSNSNAGNPLVSQLSNGPLSGLHEKVEVPVDPTKELSRLIAERKYEEAFTAALQRSDVHIVSWLCSQVDLQRFLSLVPIPLSQGVLLSLLQQLACDIHKDTPTKLGWMTDVSVAINPSDPMIAVHVRPIFEQVFQILSHHRSLPTVTPSELSSIRLVMHVINSVLTSCK